ncbi:SPOR domain-containing protein [Microvirga sp. SRT01]|uniref:SPOR domain-containing protein n=1 Tax=Sphingomonas longa TaxID=2778730 RepID=A0ABS2D3U9_9SPHN|nr:MULTISPECIES: SPOR domain-containing protein [Alphaproteobacteria]MBM6575580.1 SPOR domain-containing protein [Sphingomonas sp. BT552]MBR7708628.1 SPOR domain-containing protein [Microvirga sp. SRT01]
MADNLDIRDEDRLPWLETVEPDEPEGSGLGRVIALALAGLIVVAAIGFGIWHLTHSRKSGDGQLIAAQEGDYKVRPTEPGGLKVEGEGDSAIATSAGKAAGTGAIDLKAVPEAPVAAQVVPAATPKPKPSATPGRSTIAKVPTQTAGPLKAAAPLTGSRPVAQGNGGGGSLVQLGAFPSEAAANGAWDRFSKRFAYIAPLGKSVQPVATGGKTLYRLRVNAGSANQAADICGRLRVAGESCFVAS